MALSDIDKLAKSDQEEARKALQTGDWSKVSTAAMRVLGDVPYRPSEVVETQFSRGATSTIRGIADLFGADITDDIEEEKKSRAMFETNPIASWASYIGGSGLDPVNLIPLARVKTAGEAFLKLGAFGGITGFVEPVYDEYEDSRLTNAALGAGTLGLFGAGVTGLVNKIAGKSAKEVEEALTSQAQDSLNAATTTPSMVGPKPRLKSGPATVREPGVTPQAAGLTPEDTFGVPTTPDEVLDVAFSPPKLPSYLKNAKPRYKNLVPTFESDLDKSLYIIGKETGKRSKADDKYLEFVMQNTGLDEAGARAEGRRIIKEVGERLKTADVNSEAAFVIPTTWKPDTSRLPKPSLTSVQQAAANVKNLKEAPKLSSKLFDEPIVHNGSKLIFGSDIDKAAVAVKKNSVNKQEYLDYVKNTFGINEQQAEKIIDEISSEVLNKVNKSAVTEGKLAPQTSVPMSATLDNIVNPVFKHMDDESRYVYNYSKSLGELDGKPKVRIDEGFKQFVAKMGQIFPGIKEVDAISTAQGYQRLMDNLKLEKGAKFTSTNIRDFAANRNGNLDAFIASAKRGDMDGCWS